MIWRGGDGGAGGDRPLAGRIARRGGRIGWRSAGSDALTAGLVPVPAVQAPAVAARWVCSFSRLCVAAANRLRSDCGSSSRWNRSIPRLTMPSICSACQYPGSATTTSGSSLIPVASSSRSVAATIGSRFPKSGELSAISAAMIWFAFTGLRVVALLPRRPDRLHDPRVRVGRVDMPLRLRRWLIRVRRATQPPPLLVAPRRAVMLVRTVRFNLASVVLLLPPG